MNEHKEYVVDLISRVLDKSDHNYDNPNFRSDETISWKAYREAELLDDQKLVPILTDIIKNEKKVSKKREPIIVLGHVVKNSNDESGLNYLESVINLFKIYFDD